MKNNNSSSYSFPLILSFSLALIAITSCGGGSESKAPAEKIVVEAPVLIGPQVSGIPAKITVEAPIGSDSHQCHSVETNEQSLQFTDITEQAGLTFSHEMPNGDGVLGMSGGVAAGDFDNDGWVDLYAIGGEGQANVLMKNQGDGTFTDMANFSGVDQQNKGSGPAFGDFNGDGLLDLFVGGVGGDAAKLYVNQGNDKYLDITESSGLVLPGNNFSGTWTDYDKDGDLDLFVTHWTEERSGYFAYFWKNNGDSTFSDVTFETGIKNTSNADKTLTATFSDINNDGWVDLLLVTDYAQTRLYQNNKDGTFKDITDHDVITDNTGMGSAVADYDNDGDLDWFVTAISFRDEPATLGWLSPGNRFYQNQGDGTFLDKTDELGVRHSSWAWATCFSDFNNDGLQDLFVVNGMYGENIDEMFLDDPSRLFLANGDGTFKESSIDVGIDDTSMGRGLVCFDYDKDGDQDIYIANYDEAPKLFCNNGGSASGQNNFINIKLIDSTSNTQALGARIYVQSADVRQMRELTSGNNYVSQNPVEAHFGLSKASEITSIRIVWPDGEESIVTQVDINQFVTIERI
ncbi:MAG: CRTAC1 family protein [Colwellia sp.]|nr:CRTAC1 family protein [Colwellia sp.]